MKKLIAALGLSILTSNVLMAGSETTLNTEHGKISGKVKLIHIIGGEDNGFDPETGSVYYLNLGYTTPVRNGLSFKLSASVVGDTGFTDEDDKIGGGLFMGEVKAGDPTNVTDAWSGLSEIYLRYQNPNVDTKVGRFMLDTPMTKNLYSTEPNLYEGMTIASTKLLPQTTAVGAYLTRMSYGARSLADWSLIGEKVGMMTGASSWSKTERGHFEDFGTIAGADSTGIAAIGLINKSLKNTTVSFWDYYASDLANIIYVDALTKYKVNKAVKTAFGAQVLYEDIDGGGEPMVWGAKATVKYQGAGLTLAYNKSNSDQFVNPWGGDPLYTWSIFSRNAFRPDVSAVKVTASYKVPQFYNGMPKNLIIKVSHADYGQSSLPNVQDDAKETDIVIICKPVKGLMFKLFNAQRTSEFDGLNGAEKTQNHTRFIAQYSF